AHDTSSGIAGAGQLAGGAVQHVQLVARVLPLKFDIQASLTTGNGDAISGTAVVNGTDQNPPGWANCGPTHPPLAGIRADQGTTVTTSGNAQIIGNPPVLIDASVTDSTFSKFGTSTYAQLAARANITLPGQNFSNSIGPVVTNGQCNEAVLTNWGDGENPTQPCGNYWPIVHITGDATINGVQGQGILLVDGSLSVQGGFQWFGITIIQGQLKTAGGGNTDAHFWGATLVHDSVSVGTNKISGAANINYSYCAMMAAINRASLVTSGRSREWLQLE